MKLSNGARVIQRIQDHLYEMEDSWSTSEENQEFKRGWEKARMDVYYFVSGLSDALPQCTVCKQGDGMDCEHFTAK